MPASPRDRLAAALAGRYRLDRELGAGGMATVHLAEDLKHHRRVAVKLLHPELAQALGPDRFLREIEIAAQLRHPHILPLYDSGVVDGAADEPMLLYYIMPYVDGETLRARLDRERQLPVDDALAIAREVADALSFAHAHGVVHRDVKPENILLEAGHAIVADFGVAKAVAAAGEDTALTATGVSIGTPIYMSPEQAAGDPGVDGRSDLYSLACVLYEMLAGQPPFTGPTVESLVRQHITADPRPVTVHRPSVPQGVSDALARALAKNPADRFNPVGQFAVALTEPAARRPGGPAAGAGSPDRARRVRAVPAVLAVAAVLAVVALAVWLVNRNAGAAATAPSIAVLPFETLGADTAANPLALGLHAEIVTQLGKLGGLRVTSRGSTLEYAGSGKAERVIASELGVANLLTGSVQRAGGQVRFTVALNDPATGEQRWAERYDRALTAENLFEIQADIARQVASALQVRLTPEQQTALARPMTTNLEALDRYYRALPLWDNRTTVEDTTVVQLLEEAVALDPEFAAAWSLLAQARGWLLRAGVTRDTLRASAALARVAELAPGSLEHRLAAAYYHYYARADFAEALDHLLEADRLVPNSSDILDAIGLVLRRQGRWDESEAYFERAIAVDPRNAGVLGDLADSYWLQRRATEAAGLLSRAITLAPAASTYVRDLAVIRLLIEGDTAAARRVLDSASRGMRPELHANALSRLAALTRDRAGVVATTRGTPNIFTVEYTPPLRTLAIAHWAAGERGAARRAADALIAAADAELARKRRQGTHDPFGQEVLTELEAAIGLALRGDTAEAVARAERVASGLTTDRDAVDGPNAEERRAMVYALSGRPDEALALLRKLAQLPSPLGAGSLRLDPVWDPLRDEPGFQQIVAEVEAGTR